MALRYFPRLPILRAFVPRISPPLLPLTSRLRVSSTARPFYAHSRLFSHFPARLTSSTPSPSPPDQQLSSSPADATWTQRLKRLIKSYGWYALGVYAVLTVLDFGIAFAGVHLLGANYVSHIAVSFKQTLARLIHSKPPDPGTQVESTHANNNSGGQEGLYAMILLAYTVHKTLFLPIRIGLTGVLTPRLVSWLRARGWAGGEGTKRAATEIRERMRRKGSGHRE
jgi:hypothetical protein